jgi:hypothetical protein
VSLVSAACFSGGLAFVELALDEAAGLIDVAVLHDAGDEHDAVDATVAPEVEQMLHGDAAALT